MSESEPTYLLRVSRKQLVIINESLRHRSEVDRDYVGYTAEQLDTLDVLCDVTDPTLDPKEHPDCPSPEPVLNDLTA